MRTQAIFALLLAFALSWDFVAADDAGADGDADIDLDDIDDLDEDPGEGEAAAPVEDFDKDMPEADQHRRMTGCFKYTVRRTALRKDWLETTVTEMVANPEQELTKEQAVNTIVFSWMMTCYLNIVDEYVDSTTSIQEELTTDEERVAFTPNPERNQQVKQASSRQWELLKTTLTEEGKKQGVVKDPQAKKDTSGFTQSTSYQNKPSMPQVTKTVKAEEPKPKKSSGILYVMLLFGGIFGLILLGVQRLSKAEEEVKTKKDRKADKKGKKGH